MSEDKSTEDEIIKCDFCNKTMDTKIKINKKKLNVCESCYAAFNIN